MKKTLFGMVVLSFTAVATAAPVSEIFSIQPLNVFFLSDLSSLIAEFFGLDKDFFCAQTDTCRL